MSDAGDLRLNWITDMWIGPHITAHPLRDTQELALNYNTGGGQLMDWVGLS